MRRRRLCCRRRANSRGLSALSNICADSFICLGCPRRRMRIRSRPPGLLLLLTPPHANGFCGREAPNTEALAQPEGVRKLRKPPRSCCSHRPPIGVVSSACDIASVASQVAEGQPLDVEDFGSLCKLHSARTPGLRRPAGCTVVAWHHHWRRRALLLERRPELGHSC